jgi:hypothetical protein
MTVNVTDTVGANNTIVLDSNSKIPAIDGSQVTALSATAFTTGSFATARIDVGTTAGKILQLDSNAKIPAISGANLTNAPGPTQSTSDPTISSNLTLGTKWVNKTSGEVYICTDATAGENVWTNVGAGTDNIAPYKWYGASYGYCAAGAGGPGWANVNTIDKFSLVSASNATDVGDVTLVRRNTAGAWSATYGYAAGWAGATNGDRIDKWSMISDADATDVGNLTVNKEANDGSSSLTYGYCAGGAPSTNVIEKWSFATDGNAVDVADLTAAGRTDRPAGTQSETYGYCMGGGSTNIIDKWLFATDANATDVGDIAIVGGQMGSNTSSTHGYIVGGTLGTRGNVIEKFSYASNGDATDVGDLLATATGKFGSASSTHGYASGGSQYGGGTGSNIIEKFSFATDGNSVDSTQDLTVLRGLGASSQV